jgi:hypothetical protein
MLTQNVMQADQSQLNRGYIFAALGSAILFAGLIFIISAWKMFQYVHQSAVLSAVISLPWAGNDRSAGFRPAVEVISVCCWRHWWVHIYCPGPFKGLSNRMIPLSWILIFSLACFLSVCLACSGERMPSVF